MPYKPGDHVTVKPTELDPLILHFQRYATVVHGGEDCVIQVSDTFPPNQRFEIPARRLLPGWRPQDW
jgi:hypothetical protein